jgi:hypothetical protein
VPPWRSTTRRTLASPIPTLETIPPVELLKGLE